MFPRRTRGSGGIVLAGVMLFAAVSFPPAGPRAAAAQGDGAASPARARKNPLSRDLEAVQAGRRLYLERCAVCHGQDAKGSMAANLVRSRSVVSGGDKALYRILVQGIPGTEMPPQADLEEDQVWQVISYLHSLARPGLQPPVPGDIDAGRQVFRTAGCAGCHRVDGEGGFWGPSLDSIAAQKTSDEIRLDILEPGSRVVEGYRSVVVETTDGQLIEGLLKNEDTFSVQILTRDGTYSLLSRGEVRNVETNPDSAMPDDYGRTLRVGQLQNLLAFLDRQRDPFVPFDRGFQNY